MQICLQRHESDSAAFSLQLFKAATEVNVSELTEVKKMKQAITKFLQDEEGLTTVEYAVAGGLIAAATILAFRTLGGTVEGVITDIDTELNS